MVLHLFGNLNTFDKIKFYDTTDRNYKLHEEY
jgi:hypothetical protein